MNTARLDTGAPERRLGPGRGKHGTVDMALLETEGLGRRFGGLAAVDDVSVAVRAGQIHAIIGPNGAGKTTLVGMVCGRIRPSAGRILFEGRDITAMPAWRRVATGIVYTFQVTSIYGALTVRENVALPCLSLDRFSKLTLLRRAAEREVTDEVTRRVRLYPHALERPVEHFSGGNQQKVLLAKALARDVDVFVFDEPTVGVDVGTRVAIYNLMAELCAGGAAVVLVSSDLPEILHLTHRAYVFHHGRIVDHLVGDEITEENVLRNFLDKGAA